MRIFHIHSGGVQELTALPTQMPTQGFVWIACSRPAFQARLAEIQGSLQALVGLQLVDLHVSDLLNAQLPSHYDYTSQYDLLVFRRLATSQGDTAEAAAPAPGPVPAPRRGGPPVLRRIDTSPVGFAVFDQLLLTVHPADCAVRDAYAARLLASLPTSPGEGRSSPVPGARVPTSPADLMLRVVNMMVDRYLDLRRELTRQLDHWQNELLKPRARYVNWNSLLEARLSLHMLDEICEDQRTAVQDWIDALETWALPDTPLGLRELDLLKVRSRDVLEHIERVVHHVRRLEQSTETAVQMHFSVQSNRTNDIMRTLTALTAVFLPLNLIAGIFGMNFEFLPLIHKADGFWWALGSMVLIALGLVALFWRKQYLSRTRR
jgi:magnesium transporter